MVLQSYDFFEISINNIGLLDLNSNIRYEIPFTNTCEVDVSSKLEKREIRESCTFL
jgi:hypothetical protein